MLPSLPVGSQTKCTRHVQKDDRRDLTPLVYAYARAQRVGVPVPSVMCHVHTPIVPFDMLIMARARGESLNALAFDFQREQEVYRSVGATLRQLHGMSAHGFGTFSYANDAIVGEYESWDAYIQHKAKAYDALVRQGIISSDEHQFISTYCQPIQYTNPVATFAHFDFHGSHIFVDDTHVSDVIDFSKAGGGDALYDVANSLYYLSNAQARAFLDGYGVVDMDIVNKLFSAANKAVWSTENGFESRTHACQDLRAMLEAE